MTEITITKELLDLVAKANQLVKTKDFYQEWMVFEPTKTEKGIYVVGFKLEEDSDRFQFLPLLNDVVKEAQQL